MADQDAGSVTTGKCDLTALKGISADPRFAGNTTVSAADKNRYLAGVVVGKVNCDMVFGASDKVKDAVKSEGTSGPCVRGMRKKPCCKYRPSSAKAIEEMADEARRRGCGNCMEQAAIAWAYLAELGYEPSRLAYVTAEWDPYRTAIGEIPHNHAFVVIDRIQASSKDTPFALGPDALVCDPWKPDPPNVYPATDLPIYWPGVKNYDIF